jgi:hypothetical protein
VFTYSLNVSEVLDGPTVLSEYRTVDPELPLLFVLLLTIFGFDRLNEQMREKYNKTVPRNIFKNYLW